mmetsp:Transcript_53231/g.137699  ORF Transcript_53231/g.137699 Transcript_53231/m.137699 type:complete len:308 (+) Transcript_53231:111-1034(+)
MSSNADKLKTYQEQLAAVEAAITEDPTNEEWLKLKSDLLEVIRLTQQLTEVRGEAAAVASAGAAASAAAAELKSYAVGDKCRALFELDGQWYNAKVVALTQDGYFVTYLGYGNTAQVDFNEVRPYIRPDTSEWRVGAEVHALAIADERWYPAKLLGVSQASAKVRFHGEADVVELELDSIRLAAVASTSASSSAGAASSTSAIAVDEAKELREGKLPKSLEILPEDSADEVARKKRKINMHKRQEKKVKEETAGEDRRTSWQSFSKRNKTVKRAKNGHDPNWDPTRDHGEMAARLAIDKTYGALDAR